ncbi:uncharacterized protein RCC_05745 [Ramularia collo-cygni]|uniref:Las1-domain-containing protein n=1 Tax=Ramularia collo-cygni TaxID=112498 RepID=A0A2D3VDV3_9PEZI|nr:uncharacterized protein RCC_05745 [Ramularia collo-cygni]CZT19889.1 uncharacterized protein RCC_05745 [Ramularia collo-cygni]
MAKYTITPWRTPSDLLGVRSQLYPAPTADPSSNTTTDRLQAVNRIMAWKLRGNLPHAVESTALLTDAILHHQQQSQSSLSSFSIRAVYSAAFTRFVTGFCDIGRSRERMLEPSSMLDIARKIGMPVEFVGLRHEATHEELPGLRRLVGATEEALRWLWEVYWSRLKEVVPEVEMEIEASEEGLEKIRELLKTFRTERKLALKKKGKQKGSTEKPVVEEKTAKECVRIVGGTAQGIESLVQRFVQDKLLVPSKREIGDPLDGAYLIWDRLLRAILAQQRAFLPAFVKILLQAIGDVITDQSDGNTEKEALCMWLVHTVSKKKTWAVVASSDLDALRKEMVKWSCTHPGYWSHFLGVHLIKAGGPDFANIWEDVLEASRLGDGYIGQATVGDAELEVASSSESEMLEDTLHRSDDMEDGEYHRILKRATTSPNLPIGVCR